MWTPYQINIILHYHCSPAQWPLHSAPIFNETVYCLVADGLLHPLPSRPNCFEVTDRGRALIDMWCATPIPEQRWFDPRFSPAETTEQ